MIFLFITHYKYQIALIIFRTEHIKITYITKIKTHTKKYIKKLTCKQTYYKKAFISFEQYFVM